MSLAKPDPKFLNAIFWNECMETQVLEMRLAAKQNDFAQWANEVVDCWLVAIDALRLMGFDGNEIFLNRLAKNLTKNLQARDTQFYLDKQKALIEELEQ